MSAFNAPKSKEGPTIAGHLAAGNSFMGLSDDPISKFALKHKRNMQARARKAPKQLQMSEPLAWVPAKPLASDQGD